MAGDVFEDVLRFMYNLPCSIQSTNVVLNFKVPVMSYGMFDLMVDTLTFPVVRTVHIQRIP